MRKLRPRLRALQLARKVRERITAELGQPVKVIMYGSQARGDATRYSDIDLLIVLPSITRDSRKLISNIAWEVGLDAGKVISTIPTTDAEMKYYAILPFYENIRREGVVV
jgi:predicted nucleotidyltransferase